MRRKIIATSTAALLGLSLTACDSKDEGTITEPVAEETTVEQSTEVIEEEAVEEEPAKTNPAFGDTYTWPDGLAVTISQPEELTLSNEYTAEMYDLTAGTLLAFTITLHNGTDEDVEAFGINTQMASGSKESEAVFASEDGLDMPTSTIIPGKDLTWKVGYIVADPADLQLTVDNMSDFDAEKVHFTN